MGEAPEAADIVLFKYLFFMFGMHVLSLLL